ncbi:MAG TPA: LysR family transcriptional regulator [Burkholderiaceae bacterium]|nr:LysR family transcriptional regulator [Burkholderiaceae bacterium]
MADRGGFRAAAEDLHLSASALSRRIERLEELLGARLFQRTTRDVRLTRVGEAFIERARAALDDLESAVLGVHEISARHQGRVTVACLPTAAVTLMPQAIASFGQVMPRTRVRVIDEGMNDVAASVVSGEADFGLGFAGPSDAGLKFDGLWNDPYVLAMRRDHALARKRRLRLADLANERWLSVSRSSRNRQLLDDYLTASGRSPQAWLEVAHVNTLLAMVEAGLGVGIVPSIALIGHQQRMVVGVALADVHLVRQIGLLTLEGRRLTPVAERFYQHIKRSLAAPRPSR